MKRCEEDLKEYREHREFLRLQRDRTSELVGLGGRAINALYDSFYQYKLSTAGFQKPNKIWVCELLTGNFQTFLKQRNVGRKTCKEICLWAGLPFDPVDRVLLRAIKYFQAMPSGRWLLAAHYDWRFIDYFLDRSWIAAVSVSFPLELSESDVKGDYLCCPLTKLTKIDDASTTYIRKLELDTLELFTRRRL